MDCTQLSAIYMGLPRLILLLQYVECTSHDVRSTIAFQRILTLRYILFHKEFNFNQFFRIVLYIFLLKDFYFLF